MEELALRRRRQGDGEGVRRRLAPQDIADILGGLKLVYDNVQPRSPRSTRSRRSQTGASLQRLQRFAAAPARARRPAASSSPPSDADTLGGEAQDRAEAIAGQITQAAGQLGIELEN